ncbi:hypothetical protein Q6283_29495, partial [Klebsiella pneumoniae]|uniref:hypothetical protein n=1 Tax=Klebsiella pneumoniae TaxID=573 RepID=UPI00272F22DC
LHNPQPVSRFTTIHHITPNPENKPIEPNHSTSIRKQSIPRKKTHPPAHPQTTKIDRIPCFKLYTLNFKLSFSLQIQ